MMEVPERFRACFGPNQFVQLLHEPGENFERVLQDFIQSNSIKLRSVGNAMRS